MLSWPADTLTPAGWKLAQGDAFIAYRSKELPALFYVDLQQPAPSLMKKYRIITTEVLRQHYPMLSVVDIQCLLDAADRSAGPRGLYLLSQLSGETVALAPVLSYCNIPPGALAR